MREKILRLRDREALARTEAAAKGEGGTGARARRTADTEHKVGS